VVSASASADLVVVAAVPSIILASASASITVCTLLLESASTFTLPSTAALITLLSTTSVTTSLDETTASPEPAAFASSYLSVAPAVVSSFFFLPFMTFGAVLRPVDDYLRLLASSLPDLSVALAIGYLSVLADAVVVSATFFSSLIGFDAALSVPTGGLVVALIPPGTAFFSTT